jgi:hypothetical protein
MAWHGIPEDTILPKKFMIEFKVPQDREEWCLLGCYAVWLL